MLKAVLAGTAALTILGSTLVLAQQGPSGDAPRGRPTAEDRAAMTDARIAGLKAGLKLSDDQEKHWPAAETALREMAKQRAERREAMMETRRERREARGGDRPRERADAIERMRRGAERMAERAAGMKRFADATEPLYKSLDDAQKRRFHLLMRMGRGGGKHHWHHRGGGREG